MTLRTHRRISFVFATIAAVALTATAFAHVTVNPRSVPTGSFARFDVRVPNERPDAGTVKVELQLPEDQAFPFVSVQPHAGWTYTITKRTLAEPIEGEGETITEVVSQVTWEAEPGVQIAPGEFDEFGLSVGPMPEAATMLTFKAIQTYSSGEVVRWIEAPEAELPAPVVNVVAPTEATGAAGPAGPAGPQGDSGSNVLAIIALVVGALGLAVGGVALLKKVS